MKTATLKRKTAQLHKEAFELFQNNKLEEAHALYQELLDCDPYNDAAEHFMGLLYSQQGRFEEACQHILQAIHHYPWAADYYNSLSGVLLMCGEFEEALRNIDHALLLSPNNPASYNNKGMVLMELGKEKEALAVYEKALELSNDAYIHFNYSIALLAEGDWIKGFQEYEWRHTLFPNQFIYLMPRYLTATYGQNVLLTHEQGYGDTIQMIRYAKELKKHVKHLGVWCPLALADLLKTIPEIDEINSPDTVYDCVIPTFSLPRLFDTTPATVPCSQGYMKVEPTCLGNETFKIGLFWGSRRPPGNGYEFTQKADNTLIMPSPRSMVHYSSHKRSIHPAIFSKLTKLPNVKFYSLQKGPDAEQSKECSFPIIDNNFQTFADTAATVAALDVVITIDSVLAHLAGALGKRTFLLVPYAAEWRWGKRQTTPWYDSLTILRQPAPGNWDAVIDQLLKVV
jgi:Flp pilus assembly protein TadD